MNERIKQFIDNASYETLLYHWRYARIGDPWFLGETGEYYAKVMFEKKKQCDHVQVSKSVGWE